MGAGAGPIGVPVPGIGMRSPGIGGGGFATVVPTELIGRSSRIVDITNMLQEIKRLFSRYLLAILVHMISDRNFKSITVH